MGGDFDEEQRGTVVDGSVLLLLRLTHILAGVFWAGSVILIAGFVEPVARSLGQEGGRFMQGLANGRHMTIYLMAAGLLTVLSGLALYWLDSGGLQWGWIQSNFGLTLTVGGLAAIVALLLGQFVNAPTAKRIGLVAQSIQKGGGPPSPAQISELSLLQARLRLFVRIGAVLLVVAVAAMAVARYV